MFFYVIQVTESESGVKIVPFTTGFQHNLKKSYFGVYDVKT